MNAIFSILSLLGFGFGLEGIEENKIYIGTYTPKAEYGWIVTKDEIYLDTYYEVR
jgi:hypothetical protein